MTDRGTDRRIVHAEEGRSPLADRDPAAMVLWFPRFFLLEVVAALVVLAAASLFSLLVDAPLLELADPAVTPDPSKAPWYFIGLQELLHYYHPAVAGALVPAVTVGLAVALPYLGRPDRRIPLWPEGAPRGLTAAWIAGSALVFLGITVLPAEHVPWVIVVPTMAVVACMLAPSLAGRRGPLTAWLADRSLVGWIALWLALEVVVLSLVGGLFRGPGWSWVWPWVDGIY